MANLPISKDVPNLPDATTSIEMIRHAIDRGVNFLDMGYPFDSERQDHTAGIVSAALKNGYRDRVKIAATLPAHCIHSSGDFDLMLDRQLSRLHIDRLDFCLLGRLNRENWPVLRDRGALIWAEHTIKSGRIGSIGFSFHDHFQILRSILAAFSRWALCQMQFSYMDSAHDPGIGGIKYAAQNGLAVVVTESLRGGRLVRKIPETVASVMGINLNQRQLTGYALRFVWSFPEVSTVVRSMNSISELEETVAIADSAESDSLTIQEELLIGKLRDAYRKLMRIPCTSCRTCMPCPEEIDVPRIFEIYNDAFIYEDPATARSIYRNEHHRLHQCSRCGDCQKRCVKQLDVIEWLGRAHRMLCGST